MCFTCCNSQVSQFYNSHYLIANESRPIILLTWLQEQLPGKTVNIKSLFCHEIITNKLLNSLLVIKSVTSTAHENDFNANSISRVIFLFSLILGCFNIQRMPRASFTHNNHIWSVSIASRGCLLYWPSLPTSACILLAASLLKSFFPHC